MLDNLNTIFIFGGEGDENGRAGVHFKFLKKTFRFRNSMLQVTKTVSHSIEYLKGS